MKIYLINKKASKMAKKAKNKKLLERKATFSFLQIALFVVIFAAAGVYAVLQSSAAPAADKSTGKSRRSETGVINRLVMEIDRNGDQLPNYRDTIHFDITTTAATPYINLLCTQNGVKVYEGWQAYYDSAFNPTRTFGLSAEIYGGSEALPSDCTAKLVGEINYKTAILNTFNFTVNP